MLLRIKMPLWSMSTRAPPSPLPPKAWKGYKIRKIRNRVHISAPIFAQVIQFPALTNHFPKIKVPNREVYLHPKLRIRSLRESPQTDHLALAASAFSFISSTTRQIVKTTSLSSALGVHEG